MIAGSNTDNTELLLMSSWHLVTVYECGCEQPVDWTSAIEMQVHLDSVLLGDLSLAGTVRGSPIKYCERCCLFLVWTEALRLMGVK